MISILTQKVKQAAMQLYNVELSEVEFQQTKKEFEGDVTVVLFPMLRYVKVNPEHLGHQIGEYLQQNVPQIKTFNVIKGFLNIVIKDDYFLEKLKEISQTPSFGIVEATANSEAVMVEYASPNTNKPLHLGHIRNILLGHSAASLLEAIGKKVYKTQIINDRGIHICKSMVAWLHYGNGETPESSGLKGDKLVGKYYVVFDKVYKQQIDELIAQGMPEEQAKKQAPIFLEAQQMLRNWEANDSVTISLWQQMNQWVYTGFDATFESLGVVFDKNYYESQTYLLGKDVIEKGLKMGVFFQKEDGSIWCDLTSDGLDEKLVLRSDGTSVYITQDLGTALQRVREFPNITGMVYTVGNEQDYHFKVLFLILKKLGYSWAEHLYHLSYGMVDLPSGKMKSREGTVVDADDLISEMITTAKEISSELGKLDGYTTEEKQKLYHIIGLGALKYHILKVDPKKRIMFDPKESIDFQGNTGPFIQYAYARIQSILRKSPSLGTFSNAVNLTSKEKDIIKQLLLFPDTVKNAAEQYNPALVANYVYELVKFFNSFYQSTPILAEEDAEKRSMRLILSREVSVVIAKGFKLLGIDVPERM